jgi:putative membrane protein
MAVQHLLLLLVVPPLLLAGTPSWLLRPLLRPVPAARLARFLTRPIVAYAVFNGLMVGWHLPLLYNWAVTDEGLHIAMHLSFIGAGIVGWLPLVEVLPELPRPSPPGQLLYAALMGLPMLVIAPLIAFSETVLYPNYGEMPRLWGLSPLEDQALGGFLMWVPAHLMFLVPMTVVFLRWVWREADTPEERL